MSFLKNILKKGPSIKSYQDIEELVNVCEFFMPLEGEVVPITEVPDPVFSQKMMGDGFAIKPENQTVRSPIDGEVINVFPTKHAISLKGHNGREVLVHVGLETVSLKGQGFTSFVKDGDIVKKGDRLLEVDFDAIKDQIPSTITVVVITNLKEDENLVIKGKQVCIR